MPISDFYDGIWYSLSLHGSCVCCHNHCEYICAAALLCAKRYYFCVPTTSGPYIYSSPPFTMIPEPWEEGCNTDVQFRIVLSTICRKQKLLW